MYLDNLNKDIKEIIFDNLLERKDIYNFLSINKNFNQIKYYINYKVIKNIFLVKNWFHKKYTNDMELLGIIIWCKQFLSTITESEREIFKYILQEKYFSTAFIEKNLHEKISVKTYKYRNNNKINIITPYNIINDCFFKVLNMI
jgi:hypothetical protein